MPEGPELARSRDQLRDRLIDRRITSIETLGGRYSNNLPEGLEGLSQELSSNQAIGLVNDVNVKGKFMYWQLGNEWYLWCTYGMSGQWSAERTKHSAACVRYASVQTLGTYELYFNDPRHFGTIKFVRGNDKLAKKLESLGPDMLNQPPDCDLFRQRLRQHNSKTLAEVLMNQSVVSGVGNYVKAEALYLAELSPHREVSSCNSADLEHLRRQIVNVMLASYNNNGATIRSYLNVDGTKGGMKTRFLVYGNQTDPLGNPVVKEETKDGRTTHWVPSVQK